MTDGPAVLVPVLGLGDLGWGAGIILAAFAVLGALFALSVASIYRAIRTRRWGWLVVIVATGPLGLGWLTGAAFLFGVDRRERRAMTNRDTERR